MKSISHISFFYKPILGGQEVYIKNLNKVFNENLLETHVYQRRVKGVENESDVIPVYYFSLPSFLSNFTSEITHKI